MILEGRGGRLKFWKGVGGRGGGGGELVVRSHQVRAHFGPLQKLGSVPDRST